MSKDIFKDRPFLILIFVLQFFFTNSQENLNIINWEVVAKLPDESGVENIGYAGSFAGVSNDVMLISGGANFPFGMPWLGGKKYFSDKIFVLKKDKKEYKWHDKTFKLPRSVAYGISITTPDGIICIGGRNSEEILSDVFIMKWDNEKEEVTINELPPLPFPLAHSSGDILNNTIYIAGGESFGITTNHLLSLDLNKIESKNLNWNKLPSIPGKPRAFSVMQSQSNGFEEGLFIFSGRSYDSNKSLKILYDGYFYSPRNKNWNKLDNDTSFPFMAGNAYKSGSEFIFFNSGTDGKEFLKINRLENLINNYNSEDKIQLADSLKNELNQRLIYHKGFSKNIYAYNTITKKKSKVSELPYGVVTAPIVKWDDKLFIVSGELSPGIRTPSIIMGTPVFQKSFFGLLNSIIIGLYFLTLVVIGYFFSKRQKNTDDYFRGGGRVPWLVSGLSIFATGLSAITFMAIPAKAYATNWSYIWLNAGILLIAPLIINFIIPVYRKLNITSAYEYLEIRFNFLLRLVGSMCFILFQLGRIGVVLFLPALAINVLTGIDIYVCISSTGLLSLIYTLMGGIEAVIWTDAMQVIVLMGGAILCLVLIIFKIDGGLLEIINVSYEENKFNVFDTLFDLSKPTFWVVLFGGFFSSLATYSSDQTMVQRYITTQNEKGAIKSYMTNAWLSIPATLIFFFVGTCLYIFFKQHPEKMNFSLTNGDSIFPWYIVSELPDGIIGLLISGILAAAMSSVSSSINSAATSYSEDIHFRLFNTEKKLLVARIVTFIIGIVGTLVAIFMAGFEIKSLWDVFQKILGLIIGSMSGLFILGIFFKKVNSQSAIIAFLGSIIFQIYISNFTNTHLLLYTGCGIISCILIGLLVSFFNNQKITNTNL